MGILSLFSFTDLYLAPLSELLFHLEGKSTLLNESYFIVTEADQPKTKLKMINASIESCLSMHSETYFRQTNSLTKTTKTKYLIPIISREYYCMMVVNV